MWNHWIARTNHPYRPFQDFETAGWAWRVISTAFPEMLSAMLMPNHMHLVLPKSAHSDRDRYRLNGVMGQISRRTKISYLWEPIQPPQSIPDRLYLKRTIRYIALNPCRKNLCRDPLEWYWSTYRELMGATAEASFVDLDQLIQIFGDSPIQSAERLHRYVSSDPSVQVAGTRFPRPAPPAPLAQYPIRSILEASAAALRCLPSSARKRGPLRPLFLHLAADQGWKKPNLLAEICGITRDGVYKIIERPAPAGLDAARLCLGDPRLRRFDTAAELYKTNTKPPPAPRG